MTKKLVIIPCGAAKQEQAAPAAELYLGSMFKDALRTARTMTADENIRILSAKHGLLKLDEIVDPYEKTIDTAGTFERQILNLQLMKLMNQLSPYRYKMHLLLPKKYVKHLVDASNLFHTRQGYVTVNHFEGCAGIGYQKAVLASLRKAAA